MAWTTTERDELKAVIASGALTVQYSGPPTRTVTYQSLAEMRSLLAEMNADIDAAAGTRRSVRYASHSKGFD